MSMTGKIEQPGAPTHPVALTKEEMAHIYDCLTDKKNHATRNGGIWHMHQVNAHARTKIQEVYGAQPDAEWS